MRLNAKIRAKELPICCKCVSNTMASVEVLSQWSLLELASLYGLFLRSVLDQNDTRNIVAEPTLVLEGMLKTATRKPYAAVTAKQ